MPAWRRPIAFINYALIFICQLIFTFGFALSIYSIVTFCINQQDIEKEYFPWGSKWIHEIDQSNEYRLNMSGQYLQNAQITKFKPVQGQETDLMITVVASSRKDRYLTQTLAYLVKEIANTNWKILICSVENDLNAELIELQKRGFEVLLIYRERPFIKANTQDERIVKESFDYWTCLNQTNNLLSSQYVLMMEDDALATKETSVLLQSLIDKLNRNERLRKVDYVKLFHPWDLRKIPVFIQIIVICVVISILPVILISASRSNALYYFNAILISMALSYMFIVGNPQLPSDIRLALTSSSYISHPESCCTQGVLFRSNVIPLIVDQLSKVPTRNGRAKDHVLDESSFVGRMTDRNLFIHVGHMSAVRQNRVIINQ